MRMLLSYFLVFSAFYFYLKLFVCLNYSLHNAFSSMINVLVFAQVTDIPRYICNH